MIDTAMGKFYMTKYAFSSNLIECSTWEYNFSDKILNLYSNIQIYSCQNLYSFFIGQECIDLLW